LNDNNKKINRELVVKSTTDNLSSIRTFIKQTASDAGVTNEITGKIILAVDEACTNIIKHAYKYSSEGKITIKVNSDEQKLTIKIIDDGGHFDPDLVPEPNLEKMQFERKGGGLGMFLMKKLMDEVKYTNLPNNRNQVLLVKYRS
jgi:serine/threonine-protein kinase RsbW